MELMEGRQDARSCHSRGAGGTIQLPMGNTQIAIDKGIAPKVHINRFRLIPKKNQLGNGGSSLISLTQRA